MKSRDSGCPTTGLAPNGRRLGCKLFPGFGSRLGEVRVFLFTLLDRARFFSTRTAAYFAASDGFQELGLDPHMIGSSGEVQMRCKIVDQDLRCREAQVSWRDPRRGRGLSHSYANQIVSQQEIGRAHV